MASQGYRDVGTKQQARPTAAPTASGIPYWGDQQEAYDRVVIANITLPGICVIKGKGFEMRAQHKKVPGKHGESVIYLANEPAQWSIHVLMTTEEHLRAFEKLVPIFKPPAKPKQKAKPKGDGFLTAFQGIVVQPVPADYVSAPNPAATAKDKSAPAYVSISHPLLTLFRIGYCRIMDVSIPEQKEDKGLWQVEIKCREHVLEGSRAATTGKTGDAGKIAPAKTAFDKFLSPPDRSQSPSATNSGPT